MAQPITGQPLIITAGTYETRPSRETDVGLVRNGPPRRVHVAAVDGPAYGGPDARSSAAAALARHGGRLPRLARPIPVSERGAVHDQHVRRRTLVSSSLLFRPRHHLAPSGQESRS